MNPTVWLASYPKSGNTWFRTFLANVLQGGEEPAYINELRTGTIASARPPFDVFTGVEASDLTPDEIDVFRPDVYRRMAHRAERTGFHKVHDAYTVTAAGEPMFPADCTRGAIYLIRNPLDVAPSYAHHAGHDVDWAIAKMGDESHAMAAGRGHLNGQLRQLLLTWSGHVESWVDRPPFPVEVIRYEDMLDEPEATFARATRFAGLSDDPELIRRAIAFSSFDEVKRQEDEHGFGEKNPRSASFFRKGVSGSWRDSLTADQAAQVIADHRDVMERFGYLRDGEPVY